jgi:hypothetical protein
MPKVYINPATGQTSYRVCYFDLTQSWSKSAMVNAVFGIREYLDGLRRVFVGAVGYSDTHLVCSLKFKIYDTLYVIRVGLGIIVVLEFGLTIQRRIVIEDTDLDNAVIKLKTSIDRLCAEKHY